MSTRKLDVPASALPNLGGHRRLPNLGDIPASALLEAEAAAVRDKEAGLMCGSGGPAVGCGIAGEGLAMARGMGGMGGVGDGTPCKLIMEGMRGGRGGGACSGDRAGTLLLPSVPIAGTAAPTARRSCL